MINRTTYRDGIIMPGKLGMCAIWLAVCYFPHNVMFDRK